MAATLLVVGGAGGAELATLGSGEPPQAKVAFSFLPSTPHVGQEIVFSASATDPHDPAASYTWQWGDGDPATKRVQRHEYRSAGTYKVVLTVRDAHGREIGAIARSVTIQRPTIEHGPNAYFSFLPPSPTARKPVLFDAELLLRPSRFNRELRMELWRRGERTRRDRLPRVRTNPHLQGRADRHRHRRAAKHAGADIMVTPGRKEKLETSLALHCPTSHVRLGETATVSGTIKPARSNIPVKIIYLSSSGEEVVRTTHSAADGSYQTSYTPQAAGSWSVESSQAESLGYQESTSEPCTFSVANATGKPLNETRTTINCPPDHVRLGETVTVSGTIKPARSDIPVKVLYTAASGHASSKMATSQVGGFYTTSHMPEGEGAWSVRKLASGNGRIWGQHVNNMRIRRRGTTAEVAATLATAATTTAAHRIAPPAPIARVSGALLSQAEGWWRCPRSQPRAAAARRSFAMRPPGGALATSTASASEIGQRERW